MSRRNFDTASSDGDSDRNSTGLDCLPSAKRMLMDKFMTPRSKPMATPGSRRQAPRTGNRTGNGSSIGNGRNLRIADPIGVFCRVRPWGQSDEERCAKIVNEKSVVLTPPETSMAWKLGTAKELTFSFQQVYAPETEQKLIFENVALPLVEDVLKGKNALLFAYGVTGSGKTFTMSGTGEDSGIMPRCLDVIFNSIGKYQARKFVFKPDRLNGFDVQTQADAMLDKQREIHALTKTPKRGGNGRMAALHATASDVEMFNRKKETRSLAVASEDSQYSVFVTYIEIYNNFVYDLLDETCFDERTKKFNLQSKMLREDASHNVYVNGVTEIEVCSAEDAFDVFLRGQKRRKQAHTALNTASSRSHAVFNIRLVQAPLDSQGEEVLDEKAKICVSQLSLVDLAGSERYGRTQATGDRLKEAGNINNSLMTLRKCMDILRDNQHNGTNKPVPYRDSKLTHYLKNYFEGEGRVRMIICLNPRNDDYDENIHVMAFAELTQEVQVVRPVEKKLDPLTPGRRKANEMFKEARRRIMEDIQVDENTMPVDVNMVYGLGTPLPLGQMTKSDEETVILNLRRALEQRIQNRAELAKLVLDKRHNFRMHLIDIERDVETYRQENANLKYKLGQMTTEKESVDNVLKTIQFEKNEQDIRCEELENENRQLREELENCRMEIRQKEVAHIKDKERLKTDLELQKELNELKVDRDLQKKEMKLRESYKYKDKTFEAIRQLIEETENDHPRRSRSRTRRRSSSFSSATSDSEVQVISAVNKTRSRVISVPHLDSPLSPLKSRSGGVVVSNPRRYRAHSSDNDRWLEHTPGQPVKTGTVFQPVMKKKKSVTKLTTVDDLVKKVSKYCLNLQEADGDGGLETKLYKGDVLPSRSGGAQVVFNDVEILKQVSPTNVNGSPKKRASSAMLTFPTSPLRGGSGEVLATYDEIDTQNGRNRFLDSSVSSQESNTDNYETVKRLKLDCEGKSGTNPNISCSWSTYYTPTPMMPSPNKPGSAETRSIGSVTKSEEVNRAKKKINLCRQNPRSSTAVHCRSIQVGTYRRQTEGNYSLVHFTSAGIMFAMPHYKQAGIFSELVVPKAAIRFVEASFFDTTNHFVAIRTGVMIAKRIRQTLGIFDDDKIKFNPTSDEEPERNVIFYTNRMNRKCVTTLKNIFRDNLRDMGKAVARIYIKKVEATVGSGIELEASYN